MNQEKENRSEHQDKDLACWGCYSSSDCYGCTLGDYGVPYSDEVELSK